MADIPHDQRVDSTLTLLQDPYQFISRTCEELNSDIFETRLLLSPTICMLGGEAAELFYRSDRFVRSGAAPDRIIDTLFGRGGVQTLDNQAHHNRKQMFMEMMSSSRIEQLVDLIDETWRSRISEWGKSDRVVLYDSIPEVLCRAACKWAGIELHEDDVQHRSKQLTQLFDRAGALGPMHWTARLTRQRANAWASEIIRAIRNKTSHPAPETAAAIIARHRDAEGKFLPTTVAATELLNIVRPIVALSVYIDFIALSLHQYTQSRERVRAGDEQYVEWFVQEVRRFYPFFPFVGARVRNDFIWKTFEFPKDRLVLLDLYGTNHDQRIWDAPDIFEPERFKDWESNPYNFIPQGGGDHFMNHRCAGEWITIAVMKHAVKFLSNQIRYEVPRQDLRINRNRLPALPRSRFVMNNVVRQY